MNRFYVVLTTRELRDRVRQQVALGGRGLVMAGLAGSDLAVEALTTEFGGRFFPLKNQYVRNETTNVIFARDLEKTFGIDFDFIIVHERLIYQERDLDSLITRLNRRNLQIDHKEVLE